MSYDSCHIGHREGVSTSDNKEKTRWKKKFVRWTYIKVFIFWDQTGIWTRLDLLTNFDRFKSFTLIIKSNSVCKCAKLEKVLFAKRSCRKRDSNALIWRKTKWLYHLISENNAFILKFCDLTLIKCLALLRSPNVVWRELSPPTGTISFNFSRQFLKWARRFFSSSLWVDLK